MLSRAFGILVFVETRPVPVSTTIIITVYSNLSPVSGKWHCVMTLSPVAGKWHCTHTRSKNSQYFEARNGRPIFDKIFDAILPTHVPSKFWSKFRAHTRVKILKSCQNIDDWSKYIKQIWSVNILSQCIFWQKNLPHTFKNPFKILMSIFCFNILTDFLVVYGPLKFGTNLIPNRARPEVIMANLTTKQLCQTASKPSLRIRKIRCEVSKCRWME